MLVVPPMEEKPWPTLGPGVCEWIEENLVHGPGDLRGDPVKLSEEQRALIYRIYEVFPQGDRRAGRRRFKRVCISLAKGLAKTELAAFIAAAELHPDAPVRCEGFTRRGQPVGGGVTDPYIPMIAYTEEQSEDLAYGALRVILAGSKVANDLDIGMERIMRAKGDGKAEPLASAPDARDGARTTFQHFDETHRFVRRSRAYTAHKTMLQNIPKRKKADAWSLETTTAPAPGQGSVAEALHDYAKAIKEGRTSDPTLFFFHREADPKFVVRRPDGTIAADVLRLAIEDATGKDALSWRDVDGIGDGFFTPGADISYNERVWLNRLKHDAAKAFDLALWRKCERKGKTIGDGALITLGFDGARSDDSAALVATEVETGLQMLLGLWERPLDAKGWEVPELDVDAAVHDAFATYEVFRFYADPPFWETSVAKWAGEFGEERARAWPTYRWRPMAHAVRAFANAIAEASLGHDGDARLTRHVGNAYRRTVTVRDDKGMPMFILQKERDGSPDKIDAAMAAVLSWQARLDAIALGAKPTPVIEQSYAVDWIG